MTQAEAKRVDMRPIIFSTPMVQAILAGRKTQTRRIIKPQPVDNREIDGNFFEGNQKGYVKIDGHPNWKKQFAYEFCPYGKVGDILYVRESFRVNAWLHEDGEVNFRYEADGSVSSYIAFDDLDGETFNRYWVQSCDDLLKAGYQSNDEDRFEDYKYDALRLRPSIHMPADISRIFLKITDISVERLQDITEEDAIAEGVEVINGQYKNSCGSADRLPTWKYAQLSFKSLWQSLNGENSWEQNPWIWKIQFERIEKPITEYLKQQ